MPTRRPRYRENARLIYVRFFCLALCVVAMWLLFHAEGATRYLIVVPLFTGVHFLLKLLGMAHEAMTQWFVSRHNTRHASRASDGIISALAKWAFIGSLICLVFEISNIDNTIYGMQLFWYAGFAGLLCALVLIWGLYQTNPSLFQHLESRDNIVIGLPVAFFLLGPAAASFVNHHWAEKTVQCRKEIITQKATGGRRGTSSWVYIHVDANKTERFEVSREFYDQVQSGSTVFFCIEKGALGYEHVVAIRTN
jgi:hypothetical protein